MIYGKRATHVWVDDFEELPESFQQREWLRHALIAAGYPTKKRRRVLRLKYAERLKRIGELERRALSNPECSQRTKLIVAKYREQKQTHEVATKLLGGSFTTFGVDYVTT